MGASGRLAHAVRVAPDRLDAGPAGGAAWVDVDPDVLRRKLKPKGPEEATVVLTRVGNTAMAYLCRAEHV